MNTAHNFLTEVAEDWTAEHLAVIKDVLSEAEDGVLLRTDKHSDPLLDSPNLPNLRGQTRWVLVQSCLERAVNAGRFPGIHCNWVSLGGSSVLELVGKNTTLTPYHLHYADDVPRESTFRQSRRGENEVSPFLFPAGEGGETKEDVSDKIHLLLVHGGKDGVFAYLRVYYDRERRSLYRDLTQNIMHMASLLPSVETELVAEPEVKLKETRESKESGA